MNEALVLYDWLRRANARGDLGFEDQAEQRVLWDLEAVLEKQLTAPLVADYPENLRRARDAVRDPTE